MIVLLLVSIADPVAAVSGPATATWSMTTSSSATPAGGGSGDSAVPSGVVSPLARADSGTLWAYTCGYSQRTDDVHKDPAGGTHGLYGDVSVHGWWQIVEGVCPAKATVTVQLQVKYVKNGSIIWAQVGQGKGNYYPGPGSGKWANARYLCSANSQNWDYRAAVDVDLDNWGDPDVVTPSGTYTYACVPPAALTARILGGQGQP